MDITIILILHNRHQNIPRLVKYYEGVDAKIILADSSFQKHPSENLPSNWLHIYTPGINYTQKIETVMKEVTTKYVLLCADDDFVVPSAIEKCEIFLDENPSYSTVQGHCLCFKKHEISTQKEIDFYLIYSILNYAYEDEAPLNRIDQLLKNYKSLLYAVHRTNILKETFTGASQYISNLYLNEYNTSILPMVYGKYKELDFLYQVREYAEDSDDKTATNINTILRQPKYAQDLKKFIHYTAKKIQQAGISDNYDSVEHRLIKGLNLLAAAIDNSAQKKTSLKKRIGKLVAVIPVLGKRIIHSNRKKELKMQMSLIVKTNEDQQALAKIAEMLRH